MRYQSTTASPTWSATGPCRVQFQWRSESGQGNIPPEPARVLAALRAFAREQGYRLQEHGQLIGHFHAPWVTMWSRNDAGAMVVAVRHWVGREQAPGGGHTDRLRVKEVVFDVSIDAALDWQRRCALWNTWRSFEALAPVWERGSNWLSSSSRRLRESFGIEQPKAARANRRFRRTMAYWEL